MRAHLCPHVGQAPQSILFPAPGGSGYARRCGADADLIIPGRAGIEIPDGQTGGWHALRHYSATDHGQAGATTRSDQIRLVRLNMAARYQRAPDEAYELEMIARMEARAASAKARLIGTGSQKNRGPNAARRKAPAGATVGVAGAFVLSKQSTALGTFLTRSGVEVRPGALIMLTG